MRYSTKSTDKNRKGRNVMTSNSQTILLFSLITEENFMTKRIYWINYSRWMRLLFVLRSLTLLLTSRKKENKNQINELYKTFP